MSRRTEREQEGGYPAEGVAPGRLLVIVNKRKTQNSALKKGKLQTKRSKREDPDAQQLPLQS